MSNATLIDSLKTLWTRTVRRGDFSVVGVDVVERDDRIYATLQTIRWDGDAVQDIKEQEVLLGEALDHDDDARNAAMVDAWQTVLEEALDAMTVETFDTIVPADVVFALAGLSTCTTKEQFEKALRTKKRLGRFLTAVR